ncbi:MAG: biotin--[acetyl-CoA-carboxylase] ligase [Verrucomicrobia bacterium]|nr:MAG: biotin--[acetyl-CoA-carboxylase] ligase [Verrucomicrobiota bacterium]
MTLKAQTNSINNSILSTLLEADQAFVSGNELAQSLNISRVSIWSHLEKLKEAGFSFEAIRNRGYRIEKLPEKIHPDLLNIYLRSLNLDLPVIFFDTIDSTNSEAERQLSNKILPPLVVVSNQQTQGRGRHGRSWQSNDPGNLYLSFGFKSNFSPPLIKSFTPWIAAKLCDSLNQEFNIPIQIKWPNDLILHGKKISGMLAESRIDVDSTRDLIFGIGFNINGNPQNWPQELQAIATSLKAQTHQTQNINKMTASIIHSILSGYNQFLDNTWQTSLTNLWKKYDSLYDQYVKGFHGTEPIEGIAKGINEFGALKLLLNNGSVLLLDIGEISFSNPIKN